MEIIDFGKWNVPPIGTELIFHPTNSEDYIGIVTHINGNLVTVERK